MRLNNGDRAGCYLGGANVRSRLLSLPEKLFLHEETLAAEGAAGPGGGGAGKGGAQRCAPGGGGGASCGEGREAGREARGDGCKGCAGGEHVGWERRARWLEGSMGDALLVAGCARLLRGQWGSGLERGSSSDLAINCKSAS